MKLYYYKDPAGNFGDDLNEWLWDSLLPGCWEANDDDALMSAIGTLIGPAMPDARRWVVFSSGAGYGPPPADLHSSRWRISCVRGPLTARVLGLDPGLAVTDGASLIGALPEYAPVPESERHGVVFMPHHQALKAGDWQAVAERAGVTFLDPRDDSRATLQRIRRARLVIADAMHAAIAADAMRVPWVPVTTSVEISTFKWLDWTMSLGLPYDPIALPSSSALEAARQAMLPLFGRQFTLAERTEDAALEHYRRDRRMKSQALWPLRRNIGHGAYNRLVRPAITMAATSAWRRAEDKRRQDDAAAALMAAARQEGFLSEDRIDAARRDELMERLHTLVPGSLRMLAG